MLRALKARLTCRGCRITVSTSPVPIYWTCTNCGHFNQTR